MFIVGAYAAMPGTRHEQEEFLAGLTQLATGLEIPWRGGGLDADPAWLAGQLAGRFPHSVVTAIPDTMRMLGTDPSFGLASPDAEGRAAALEQARQIFAAVRELNESAGERVVECIEFQSAPSHIADAQALVASLLELRELAAAEGVGIVLEHCDARGGAGAGEKNFLSLGEEIEACERAGVKIALNWGRSVIESHDVDRPRAQAQLLAERGLLAGLICSGAGGTDTAYGPGWGDTHLPLKSVEPTSLMTPELVAEFVAAGADGETGAGGVVDYLGVKVQVPADASPAERVAIIAEIKAAMG
ncbi:DUF4862 family protein [Trueperella pecoris]|uniref:DUF4862 family protein n=1 Tax=Trueperella pecoris TaxID=2733571 RepID=UPI00186BA0AD|nr:DUF4862 family protein [Trueperella pecoris]QOQ38130.1 DUF4862 family protein [Trueperella pecoris]